METKVSKNRVGSMVRTGQGTQKFCNSCGSENFSKFLAETAIHFPGLKNVDMPIVWVFPELVVCLDCGIAAFVVPEAELRQLQQCGNYLKNN